MSSVHPVPSEWAASAKINAERYDAMYAQSLSDPEGFWRKEAQRLDWMTPFTKVKNTSFNEADFGIKWFEDGALNVSANCIDRHVVTQGDAVAILWEGDSPGEERRISYRELHEEVCRLANALKANGVRKGDRVTIYLPMIPEAAFSMLACARIGAIHSVVFGGFSPDSLAGRIQDCDSSLVITADEGLRGGKKVPLKANVDEALTHCPSVSRVLVVRRTGGDIMMKDGPRYLVSRGHCPRRRDMRTGGNERGRSAVHPLHLRLHRQAQGRAPHHGGYLVWASMTHEYVFDYRPGDIYWCAADVGWVTGHSYIVYGPLANGATTLMFEGVPNYPDPAASGRSSTNIKVNIFYTAPTALRALMREGDECEEAPAASRCALLGRWASRSTPKPGNGITTCRRGPLPDRRHLVADRNRRHFDHAAARRHMTLKPGSATRPIFGVKPELVDNEGQGARRRGRRQSVHHATAGRARCAPSGAITSASSRPISAPIRASISPATAAAATRTAITGSPGASTT
jgi:acetyl-CoA synthetase